MSTNSLLGFLPTLGDAKFHVVATPDPMWYNTVMDDACEGGLPMNILNEIKEKLTALNEDEIALLAKQREIEAKLVELRIKQSVYEDLFG